MEQQRSKTEIQIQAEIWKTIWKEFPETRRLLFHVPNESTYDDSQQASSGVIPGVPDLLFAWRGFTWYIELKDDTGRISDAQKVFHANLDRQGIKTWLFFNSLDCIVFLRNVIPGADQSYMVKLMPEHISPYSDGSKYDFYLSEWQRKKQEARARKAAKTSWPKKY